MLEKVVQTINNDNNNNNNNSNNNNNNNSNNKIAFAICGSKEFLVNR